MTPTHTEQNALRQNSRRIRDALVKQHQRLVPITVARVYAALPHGIERDDLLAIGYIGLLKAAARFDPKRGVQFKSYAIQLIRAEILEFLRENDWTPRLVREQSKALHETALAEEARLGRLPTEEELARALNIDETKLRQRLRNRDRMLVLSLDQPCKPSRHPGSAAAEPLYEFLPANDNVFEAAAVSDRNALVARAIARLPERERETIRRYYSSGETFKAIGQALGCSESRAYQLHAQACARLRSYLEGDKEGLF